MSVDLWPEVQSRLDDHVYMAGVQRTVDRIRASAEIFTPSELVVDLLSHLDLEDLAPGRTVLDPACGDGQFLVAAKWIKVLHFGATEEEASRDLYGVDIMADNVVVASARLGGGTIVHGDILNPHHKLPGQTPRDRALMADLFGDMSLGKRKRVRVSAELEQGTASSPQGLLFG